MKMDEVTGKVAAQTIVQVDRSGGNGIVLVSSFVLLSVISSDSLPKGSLSVICLSLANRGVRLSCR